MNLKSLMRHQPYLKANYKLPYLMRLVQRLVRGLEVAMDPLEIHRSPDPAILRASARHLQRMYVNFSNCSNEGPDSSLATFNNPNYSAQPPSQPPSHPRGIMHSPLPPPNSVQSCFITLRGPSTWRCWPYRAHMRL